MTPINLLAPKELRREGRKAKRALRRALGIKTHAEIVREFRKHVREVKP